MMAAIWPEQRLVKPHIYRRLGRWSCESPTLRSSGDTVRAAFGNWQVGQGVSKAHVHYAFGCRWPDPVGGYGPYVPPEARR